jgi:cystathionine beta-lyase/cystathionine gamma-synthase
VCSSDLGLLRLSCGIEETEDVMADLMQALGR